MSVGLSPRSLWEVVSAAAASSTRSVNSYRVLLNPVSPSTNITWSGSGAGRPRGLFKKNDQAFVSVGKSGKRGKYDLIDPMTVLGHSVVEGAPVGPRWHHGWEGERLLSTARPMATGIPMNSKESNCGGVRESGIDVRGGQGGRRDHGKRSLSFSIVALESLGFPFVRDKRRSKKRVRFGSAYLPNCFSWKLQSTALKLTPFSLKPTRLGQ